jgi:hypothetical protein
MTELKGAQGIKELLNNKKRKWSQIMESVTPMWVEKFGTTIKPPLLLTDIEQICNEKQILLPEDLLYYLSQISREFFVNMYPVEFDLTNLPTIEDVNNFEIPESIIYLNNSKIDSVKLNKVMLKVGDDYENFSTIYIGKGSQFGSIWYYINDDNIWIRKNDNIMLEVIKELNNNVTNQIQN